MNKTSLICALLLCTASLQAVDRYQAAQAVRLLANTALLALAPGAPVPTLAVLATRLLPTSGPATRARPTSTAMEGARSADDLGFAFVLGLAALFTLSTRGDVGYWKYQLERGFYKSSFPTVDPPADETCVICLEKKAGWVGPCPRDEEENEGGHKFHPECINLWTDQNNTCPSCRAKLVGVRSRRSPIDGMRTIINNGDNNKALAIAGVATAFSWVFLSHAVLKALDIIDAYPTRTRKLPEPSRLQRPINILWY